MTILYVHGLLGSPQSEKVKYLESWFGKNNVIVPKLYSDNVNIIDDFRILEQIVKENKNLFIIGSSFGGFLAHELFRRYDLPTLLINPLLNVNQFGLAEIADEYFEKEGNNYYLNIFCSTNDEIFGKDYVNKIADKFEDAKTIHYFDNKGHRFINFCEQEELVKDIANYYYQENYLIN